ncbi:unnamed protein product, partial [Linum tenue]
ESILELPEGLVRRRWSKKPKTLESLEEPGRLDESQLFALRYGTIQQHSLQLMLKGAKSSECFKIAREGIQSLCEKLDM